VRDRLPIESTQPVLVFAIVRLALTALATTALLILSVPDRGEMLLVLGAGALPWTLLVLAIAALEPKTALNPVVAVGDFALLLLLETVAPDSYAAVRFAALFLIAVHAHFQGELRGLAVAGLGSAALVVPTAVQGDGPTEGGLLAFYETVFILVSLATAALIGRLRTSESASRLQAQLLSRRTIQAETEVRRRVAEAIHDGPVQDLIGIDMILSAARQAAAAGDGRKAGELVDQARELTSRNVSVLRDEIVDLGPYAFEELSYSSAIENCMDIWKRRYGFEVLATIQALELPAEIAGDLFRITQEAVVNAGRHSAAEAVAISLRRVGSDVELRVTDNGKGFDYDGPLAVSEPGHLGLASMRERAELMEGSLEIETSDRGTRVLVRAPLGPG
jgi:two-component system NarL family sensor kinase